MTEQIGGISAAQAAPGAPAAPQQTMEEFVASRNGGGSLPPTAENSPESAPGARDAESPETPEQTGSEPEGATNSKAVKELIGLRKRAHQVEAEAAYWRGVAEGRAAAGLPSRPAPAIHEQPEGPPVRPVIEDFETFEEFEAARDRWTDDMVDFRAGQIRQAVTRKTAVDTVQQAFVQRLDEAVKTAPQLQEAFQTVGTSINGAMAEYIRLSPFGPQLILYLNDHMEQTARLARSNPYIAIGELAQIASRLGAQDHPAPGAPAPQQSKAPPPVRPVANNGAPVDTPLDKKPIGEFMSERNKAQYGR
jgi:hypothetical protein